MAAEINALRNSLTDEMVRAIGLPKNARLQRIFGAAFHGPIEQFSSGGVTIDQMVESVLYKEIMK